MASNEATVSPPNGVVRVALIQSEVTPDKRENVERSARAIEAVATRGAQLVCLQELFATPYFCQTEDPAAFELAEALDGDTVTRFSALARRCQLTLVVPLFERRAAGLYHNSLVVLGPSGETLGVYRKMHIPDDPGFYEKYYFAPGDLGFVRVDTPAGALGPLICWDQWFPEAARLTALQGASILIYPTAIGWSPEEKTQFGASQLSAWQTIQRAHAIANGVFVLSINRAGTERVGSEQIEFWGHSFAVDPFGNVLASAAEGAESLLVDLDLSLIEKTRQTWPFLRDRRVDAYAPISQRWLG